MRPIIPKFCLIMTKKAPKDHAVTVWSLENLPQPVACFELKVGCSYGNKFWSIPNQIPTLCTGVSLFIQDSFACQQQKSNMNFIAHTIEKSRDGGSFSCGW